MTTEGPLPKYSRFLVVSLVAGLVVLALLIIEDQKTPFNSNDLHADALTPGVFVSTQDTNVTSMYIKMLHPQDGQIESCYEVRKTEESEGFRFCYPAVTIAGFGGCGASQVQQFLTAHPFIKQATSDEIHCPRPEGSMYEYLRAFAATSNVTSSHTSVRLHTCLWPSDMQAHLTSVLSPRTANVFVVCNQPDRTWSVYNTFCDTLWEKTCSLYTTSSMYRSPRMLHEYLQMQQARLGVKSANHPQLNVPMVPSCAALSNLYTHRMDALTESSGRRVLVLARESLRTSYPYHSSHIRKLENYINYQLGTNFTLNDALLHSKVSTPTQDAVTTAIQTASFRNISRAGSPQEVVADNSLYASSRFEPILPITVQYVMNCWQECAHISEITGYAYNCSQIN
jgi:hypothetical protein